MKFPQMDGRVGLVRASLFDSFPLVDNETGFRVRRHVRFVMDKEIFSRSFLVEIKFVSIIEVYGN